MTLRTIMGHRDGMAAKPSAVGARPVFTRGQRLALLAAFALLLVLRLPNAWAHGRFLDEEATVFLAYAWHWPWHEALFRPFAGYLNLGATASTTLLAALVKGGIVSLERAPYVTMTIALAVQLVPAVLLLTGRAAWLADCVAVVAALLILAIGPAIEEVFANVIHIQFHLALCVGLILMLAVPHRPRARAGYAAILFLAPLCGPVAILILPLFALRALVDRDGARLGQIVALTAGAATQLLLFYGGNPIRGHLLDPLTVAAMMVDRLVVMPVAGFANAFHFGVAIYASWTVGGVLFRLVGVAGIALFAALVAVAARRRDGALWLVLSALIIAAATYGFGAIMLHPSDLFSPGAGERYNFLPETLLLLALLIVARRPGGRFRAAWTLPALAVLCFAAVEYFRPLPDYRDGPSWPAEVAAWRRDHRHPLAVWPRPFVADLADENRRCSPVTADVANNHDPRYCEGGWAGGVLRRPHPPLPR